jgi:hypothetical protein
VTEEIRQLAFAVRTGIENSTFAWPQFWSQFPRGACGDASLILGAVLDDSAHTGFEYICGVVDNSDGTSPSHAWLQRGDLIVDITADQFPDVADSVIVSTDSWWHRKWRVSQRSPGDLKKYPIEQVAELYRLYGAVLKKLPRQ